MIFPGTRELSLSYCSSVFFFFSLLFFPSFKRMATKDSNLKVNYLPRVLLSTVAWTGIAIRGCGYLGRRTSDKWSAPNKNNRAPETQICDRDQICKGVPQVWCLHRAYWILRWLPLQSILSEGWRRRGPHRTGFGQIKDFHRMIIIISRISSSTPHIIAFHVVDR